jgi:hypothetical protein
MSSFWSRLRPARLRSFALLDGNGLCLALRQCRQPPEDGRWIEVTGCRPHWVHRHLPAEAWLRPQTATGQSKRPL